MRMNEEEEEEIVFNNITRTVRHIHTNSIVHFVILLGNRMAVRRLPAIPRCKLYISEKKDVLVLYNLVL